MDNQVAKFETQEKEWAVDRILSHKGNRSDAVFEVKWKAGDVTWLPYDQVDHLGALQDYFDVLGIGTIADLTGGNEALSVEHYHVFLGGMGLSEDYFKTPAQHDYFPSTSFRPSHPMSSTPRTIPIPIPMLVPAGIERFILPDRYNPNVTLLVGLDQLWMYLQHDTDLCGGATPSSIPSPVRYDEFAIALNTNVGNGIQVTFIPEVLWDNLERIKKQRQWREKGVTKRQAKHQKREDDDTMKPFAPSKTVTNALVGPSNSTPPAPASNSNPTPQAPSTPPPELPSPPENPDTEMSESTEATTEARVAKAKGHIPKK
ncbi:hypothetical protein F4604DRAFT_1925370 [Suillus subluteus]|nr:hypothetical protein F4604DRAFT_1925370 [Suillus subluteus]